MEKQKIEGYMNVSDEEAHQHVSQSLHDVWQRESQVICHS